ncbi:MAG: hypothetical protein ACTHL3_06765 [Candidatus Nitrosocosmicus sp.]
MMHTLRWYKSKLSFHALYYQALNQIDLSIKFQNNYYNSLQIEFGSSSSSSRALL